MRRDGVISDADAQLASAYPLQLATQGRIGRDRAVLRRVRPPPARREVRRQDSTTQGLKVYTTLDLDMQRPPSGAGASDPRDRERASTARSAPTYEQYLARASTARTKRRQCRTRRICRARSSRWIRAPARCARWSAAAIRRFEVRPRHAGEASARFDVQANRLRRRDPERHVRRATSSTTRRSTVPQMDGKQWTPQNYDLKFDGPIPMRERSTYRAISPRSGSAWRSASRASSTMAKRFGITTPMPPYPSINIGSADVYPIEMVAAYSTFATSACARCRNRDAPRREREGRDALGAEARAHEQMLSPKKRG